ncbi:nucleoside hydrolase [Flagellimonas sp. S174]|uniref:nucleoside hydrolase n=1 Tax=Flagellimonas sp. S174 TaxID=3410790 RepID=UPI003BF56521
MEKTKTIVYAIALFFCTLGHCQVITNNQGVEPSNQRENTAVPVIFDTDIAEDYDDVGAIATLYALEHLGELKVLATVSSNAYETTVPTLSVLNTYFGKSNIPIGVTKRKLPSRPCTQGWAQEIIKRYPHNVTSNEEAYDAVSLYRKILAGQEDKSTTILTVGFFTNLADLLESGPDEYSELTGVELIEKKTRLLISMAGRMQKKDAVWKEYNIKHDIPAARLVFEKWTTPIIMSPFEVGKDILTGIPLMNNKEIINSPVKDAYRIALTKDNNKKGRMSWDQTVVLIAAKGVTPYFNSKEIDIKIKEDGTSAQIRGNRVSYLSLNQDPGKIAEIIEELMAYVPSK